MSFVDEYNERLISRKLDGELSSAEESEFSRLLDDSAEFRAAWENARQLDEQCADVLDALFPITSGTDADAVSDTAAKTAGSSGWMIAVRTVTPLALAACIAIAFIGPANQDEMISPDNTPQTPVVSGFPATPDPDAISVLNDNHPTQVMPANYLRPVQIDPDELRQARTNRSTNSEWIGVRGKDGRIYWIELKHTRTMRRAGLTDGAKLAGTHY